MPKYIYKCENILCVEHDKLRDIWHDHSAVGARCIKCIKPMTRVYDFSGFTNPGDTAKFDTGREI